MEHKFYTDNFERLLRERSDEFRMYPSKRVWHSIYNDLHPDRKWPSIAVSFVLVTILFLIGYWNNNLTTTTTVSGQQNALAAAGQAKKNISLTEPTTTAPFAANNSTTNTLPVQYSAPAAQSPNEHSKPASIKVSSNYNRPAVTAGSVRNTVASNRHTSVNNPDVKNTRTALADAGEGLTENIATGQNTADRDAITTTNHNQYQTAATAAAAASVNSNDDRSTVGGNIANANTGKTIAASASENAAEITDEPVTGKDDILVSPSGNADAIPVNSSLTGLSQKLAAKPTAATLQAAAGQLTQEDKSWIEHYALYNKPSKKWWKGRLNSEIYFTPGVAFRKMTPNTDYALAYSSITNNITTPGSTVNFDQLNYNPGVTFEAGAGVSYAIAKNIRLKTGLQFNFNNYSIDVSEINHPVLTTLLLTDISTGNTYQEGRRSSLANVPGYNKQKVHNQTSQISLPVGVAIKLKGGNKLEWYAGAAIQPTYVLGGKANLISFDHKNYVADPAMIRSWNLHTAFETYIHYKLDGFTLQAGPQFRYQMMSTYSKKYTYSESLYNVGLKIGLVKNF
ncbi:MAG: hypothetical protein U0V75_09205 [Ferruginibacter sp.]